MHRLYLQIYAALIGILVVLSLLMAAAVWQFARDGDDERWLGELTRFANTLIPPASAPIAEVERVLSAFAKPLELDLSFYSKDGRELVRIGEPHRDMPTGSTTRWFRDSASRRHRVLLIVLDDGRRLMIDGHRDFDGRPIAHLLGFILLLGLATGLVAFPVSRRLTRRLETLKQHVDRFGDGELDARAPVEGRDEIAMLAGSFNAAADRIEALLSDRSRLLATTSHELRTPLTRVRMALELLQKGPRPDLLSRIDRDIEELDDLIGELLIASRLDAPEKHLERIPVDLLALIAEEAAHHSNVRLTTMSDPTPFEASPNDDQTQHPVDGMVEGMVEGDPRLLRRLVRNLIQNALRHGEPPVEIGVTRSDAGDGLRVVVADRGAGVPESERERIFEPFYRPAGQPSAEAGLGLGLALVRQIAEEHGGWITCEAREGGGTRFVLELPAR